MELTESFHECDEGVVVDKGFGEVPEEHLQEGGQHVYVNTVQLLQRNAQI